MAEKHGGRKGSEERFFTLTDGANSILLALIAHLGHPRSDGRHSWTAAVRLFRESYTTLEMSRRNL